MPPLHHKISVTQEQLSTLVDFMERHGDLSIVYGKGARNVLLWVELIGILNQIGVGPRKSLEQWKKTWSDLKYRTKEKVLKMQQACQASSDGNTTLRRNLPALALTDVEKKVCEVIKTNRRCLQEPSLEFLAVENPKHRQEPEEKADPVFIDFIDHTESLSPAPKAEIVSPSPSPTLLPDTDFSRKRKRSNSYEDSNESFKRERTTLTDDRSKFVNIEDEKITIHDSQLIELKRLELETLRENNLHEREKERMQIDKEKFRETIKFQEKVISFLQDIKPALIKFLNK